MNAHEIDYKIHGEEMQFVEIELDPQEAVIAEAGSFMMMEDDIVMNTMFGDGSGKEKGLFGKLLSAGKRVLTGESLFMTVFHNNGRLKRTVSFASPYPGKIIPIDLSIV
ncbi:MAG TPA: AIM24 family protein, partial [Flavobacteriia bacterium]|nr:AIM24 family protein [Flavobacteriia bacterium]